MDLTNDADFQFLLFKIKQKLGVDFTDYRLPCLKRRIDSRIRSNHLENYRDYAHFLERNSIELDQLLKTLTIHLTEFFRDKPAWRIIQQQIIPLIVQQKSIQKDKHINVWSAGSSSGEEAYTLAILFDAILGQQIKNFSLKIYGTDIDKDSLQKAVQGSYPKKFMHYIPRKILNDYFSFDGNYYQINENMRRITQFQYSDLVSSEINVPMDLIVCRNVLIYFNRKLQMKTLEKFSRLLKEGGFLMLGKTESIVFNSQDHFKIFNATERIYRKTN